MSLQQEVRPGARVRARQHIDGRDRDWAVEVEGTVVKLFEQSTGSWYAHARGGRLRLQRLQLRKDDGEITTLVLEPDTEVEVLAAAPSEAHPAGT